MTPIETYNAMTDAELIKFVAAKLPKLLWRIEKKPRCWLCKDAILDAIAKQGEFADQGGRF